jgi:ribosomal protein L37AE/L43A
VKGAALSSKLDSLVCPFCEVGKLRPSDRDSMRCESCSGRLSAPMLESLRWIIALPDVLGSHACECGHPEMRCLPDGVFQCPACGSEVLPINTHSALSQPNAQNTSGHNVPIDLGPCTQEGGTSPPLA